MKGLRDSEALMRKLLKATEVARRTKVAEPRGMAYVSSATRAVSNVARGGASGTISNSFSFGSLYGGVTIQHQGGIEQNASRLEDQVKEILLRTLYAAQAAAV